MGSILFKRAAFQSNPRSLIHVVYKACTGSYVFIIPRMKGQDRNVPINSPYQTRTYQEPNRPATGWLPTDAVAGENLGGGCRGCAPPPPPEMTCGFPIQLVFCKKKLCGLMVLKKSKRRVHRESTAEKVSFE